jgi:hypothetical protein
MADVVFTHTIQQWTKLQLSMYVLQPGLFEIGETVIERISNGNPMVVADGTGQNVLEATDEQLQIVIDNGRPPDDSVAKFVTRQYWKGLIRSAREKRDAYLGDVEADPLKDEMEE